jgi:hypothetical protein
MQQFYGLNDILEKQQTLGLLLQEFAEILDVAFCVLLLKIPNDLVPEHNVQFVLKYLKIIVLLGS